MSSVSVVIPNFNGCALLEHYLPSVRKALCHSSVTASEIIVSDDGSTDDSVAYLRKQYPDIIVVESALNTGFAPAANRGIVRATMDAVLMLNTDMELLPDTIGVLLSCMTDGQCFCLVNNLILEFWLNLIYTMIAARVLYNLGPASSS